MSLKSVNTEYTHKHKRKGGNMPKSLPKAALIFYSCSLCYRMFTANAREKSAPIAFFVLNSKRCHFPSFSKMSFSNNRVLDLEGNKPIFSFYRY